MRFGPTHLRDAESAILAHGFRLPDRVLKKGQRLAAEEVAALRAAGYDSVVTARPDPSDVAENDAARALAEALAGAESEARRGVEAGSGTGDGAGAGRASESGRGAGDGTGAGTGLVTGNAFTGRCNLLATVRGVLCVDEEGLVAMNAVGEELTVATLPPFTVVDPRRLAATVKVITFAVARAHLDACLRVVRERGGIIRVAEFRSRRAGLVQTVLPGLKHSLLDKTRSVLRDKLAGIGATLAIERRCVHTVDAAAFALQELVAAGCDLVLVLGASAIVDRRDVVPAAIEATGGTVHRLGLPVDPGNLCLYASVGAVPVLGLPGSSRSPASSGADLLLKRIGAELSLTDRELASWGAGGLLKEQLGRPSPRSAPAADDAVFDAPPGPHPREELAAVVLAAGQSRRMGRRNKLLEHVAGEPMVRHAVRVAVAATAAAAGRPSRRQGRKDKRQPGERRQGGARVVVVTGHERERVEAALAGFDVIFAHNPDYEAGLGTSLARGVAALPRGASGAIVCLGDMPGVRVEHLDRLRDAFDPEAGAAICVATHRGKRGNPVLFAARFFIEMCDVQGDVGARHLVGAYAELVREVEMPDDGVLLDIDSPSALRIYRAGENAGEPSGGGRGVHKEATGDGERQEAGGDVRRQEAARMPGPESEPGSATRPEPEPVAKPRSKTDPGPDVASESEWRADG